MRGDGRPAVGELPLLGPDVLLMDVRMAALDGIAVTAQLRRLDDPLDLLVLTTLGEDEVLWDAIEAGAAGFVLKDSSAEDLIAACLALRRLPGGGRGRRHRDLRRRRRHERLRRPPWVTADPLDRVRELCLAFPEAVEAGGVAPRASRCGT